jgi:hypothetical protein
MAPFRPRILSASLAVILAVACTAPPPAEPTLPRLAVAPEARLRVRLAADAFALRTAHAEPPSRWGWEPAKAKRLTDWFAARLEETGAFEVVDPDDAGCQAQAREMPVAASECFDVTLDCRVTRLADRALGAGERSLLGVPWLLPLAVRALSTPPRRGECHVEIDVVDRATRRRLVRAVGRGQADSDECPGHDVLFAGLTSPDVGVCMASAVRRAAVDGLGQLLAELQDGSLTACTGAARLGAAR